MYVQLDGPEKTKFFQGDIIDNFPLFIHHTNDGFIDILEKRKEILHKGRLSLASPLPKNISGIFPGTLRRIILLSQTCDIQSNDYIQVAPILSAEEAENRLRTSKERESDLESQTIKHIRARKGRVKDWFYLPASNDKGFFYDKETTDDFPDEGFVFLQITNAFPRNNLGHFLSNRVISLSDWGRASLAWSLGDYFGRPIENKYRIE